MVCSDGIAGWGPGVRTAMTPCRSRSRDARDLEVEQIVGQGRFDSSSWSRGNRK
jgi:hypothetical protein